MIQENELVTLLVALGVLIFMSANVQRLRAIPAWSWFLGAYGVLTAGWILTVLEGFFWGEFLNLLEHLGYGASALLLVIWVWRGYGGTARWRSS